MKEVFLANFQQFGIISRLPKSEEDTRKLSKSSESCRRCLKAAEDVQRLPKMSTETAKDVHRLMTDDI